MMQSQNQALRLTLSEDTDTYQLESMHFPQGNISSSISVLCKVGSTPVSLLNSPWEIHDREENTALETPLGKMGGFRLEIETSIKGVWFMICMGLSPQLPLALIKLDVVNEGTEPLEMLNLTPLDISPGDLRFNQTVPADPVFFNNGRQSWSSSGSYRRGERQRTSHLGRLRNNIVVNTGTPQPKGTDRYSGDMFGILGDRTTRIGFLPGFLSQKEQFGTLEAGF